MSHDGIPLNSGTESKKPVPASVKAEVYDRAKGRCESCREKLTRSQGEFHHWGKHRITPSAGTVQFLCPGCHKTYGHAIKVVVHRGLLRKWKETTIVRLPVRKHPKRIRAVPAKKPMVKKKTAAKKTPAKKKPAPRKKTSKKSSRRSRAWFVPKT